MPVRDEDYVALFAELAFRVRSWVEKGRIRVSYSALRRWSRMTSRQKHKVIVATKRLGCMDEALRVVERTTGAQLLAARQRRLAKAGTVPWYLLNNTPPAWSSDLEAFFIPPDKPDRELNLEIRFVKPIGRTLKRYASDQKENPSSKDSSSRKRIPQADG